MEFIEFPKIPRLSRNIVITEKIDGTNAQVNIIQWNLDGLVGDGQRFDEAVCVRANNGVHYMLRAGSRNRWITPENDNYGFAKWVWANAHELVNSLGEGAHFGEWWGSGIQRGYGLINGEKRFSLFNVGRWNDENKPSCCYVVPKIYQGTFTTDAVQIAVDNLIALGSLASPGFMNPEGVIIFHAASGYLFKKTCKDDEKPKGSKEIS